MQYTTSIGMADGAISVATKRGMVKLNSNLILNDVFYLPRLNCNLISMVQLLNELLCTVSFSHKLCVIQNQTMMRLIGMEGAKKTALLLQRCHA